MRAWAWGLRRISMWSIPGSLKSSVKLPLPRMRRSSSTRLTRAPSPPTEISSTATSGLHLPSRPLDGVDDVLVAGAAAEVSRDGPPDVVLGGVGGVLQQGRRRQHHARSAEPALEAVLLREPFLDGVQLARPAQAFDGGELMPVGLDTEEGARLHGQAVEQHGAGAATGRVAAEVGPGQAEHLPEHVHAQQAGLDLDDPGFPVDRDLDLLDLHDDLLPQTREATVSKRRRRMSIGSWPIAACRALDTKVRTRCRL